MIVFVSTLIPGFDRLNWHIERDPTWVEKVTVMYQLEVGTIKHVVNNHGISNYYLLATWGTAHND